MNNVETSIVTLSVGDDTNTTHVATTSNHGYDTSVELDVFGDLAGSKVDLDSVINLNGWIRITDTMCVVSISVDGAFIPLLQLRLFGWINQSLEQRLNDGL